jgi:hypothetical protein
MNYREMLARQFRLADGDADGELDKDDFVRFAQSTIGTWTVGHVRRPCAHHLVGAMWTTECSVPVSCSSHSPCCLLARVGCVHTGQGCVLARHGPAW